MSLPLVALWNPAYPLSNNDQVASTIASAERFCRAIGGSLFVDESVHHVAGIGAWAPAATRRAALSRIAHADVWLAARGGYGCVDLLPALLSRDQLPYLIGYSDLTVFHAAFYAAREQKSVPESLYGYMPGVKHGERAFSSAVHNFFGEKSFHDPATCPEAQPLAPGSAAGTLFTGCLTVLAGLCGSAWMPDLSGCILCIEDIDERPYRLDRALWQLHASGCLSDIVGLLSNDFPAPIPDGYEGPSARDIITKWARQLDVPALFGFPFGHHPDPIALPCGRSAQLDVQDHTWSLTVAERQSNSSFVSG
jgi:muramoyltetrapeptide carboxypeptidase